MTQEISGLLSALTQAQPNEAAAHQNFLTEALQMVEGQGGSVQAITQQAGATTTNPQEMSHSDLIDTTLALARSHPEIVQMVAQRYPQAQGIISAVLGNAAAANLNSGEGQMLGGLLSRIAGNI